MSARILVFYDVRANVKMREARLSAEFGARDLAKSS